MGILVNPAERGEMGPDLFRAACPMGSMSTPVPRSATLIKVFADEGAAEK
jgi:hypothetical protein